MSIARLRWFLLPGAACCFFSSLPNIFLCGFGASRTRPSESIAIAVIPKSPAILPWFLASTGCDRSLVPQERKRAIRRRELRFRSVEWKNGVFAICSTKMMVTTVRSGWIQRTDVLSRDRSFFCCLELRVGLTMERQQIKQKSASVGYEQ